MLTAWNRVSITPLMGWTLSFPFYRPGQWGKKLLFLAWGRTEVRILTSEPMLYPFGCPMTGWQKTKPGERSQGDEGKQEGYQQNLRKAGGGEGIRGGARTITVQINKQVREAKQFNVGTERAEGLRGVLGHGFREYTLPPCFLQIPLEPWKACFPLVLCALGLDMAPFISCSIWNVRWSLLPGTGDCYSVSRMGKLGAPQVVSIVTLLTQGPCPQPLHPGELLLRILGKKIVFIRHSPGSPRQGKAFLERHDGNSDEAVGTKRFVKIPKVNPFHFCLGQHQMAYDFNRQQLLYWSNIHIFSFVICWQKGLAVENPICSTNMLVNKFLHACPCWGCIVYSGPDRHTDTCLLGLPLQSLHLTFEALC